MIQELEKKLNAALDQHQYSTALEFCEQLYEAGQSNPHLKAVKGWSLFQTGNIKDSEPLLVEAFNEDPTQHFSATMIMSFYMDRANYHQVITVGQYCAGLHAKDRLIWHRLATAHFMLGDVEAAVIAFRRSLQVEYKKLTAFALSQPLLCQGNYQEGFELYEHRFESYPKLNWPQCERMPMPQWQGESLKGKSLLVWTEQGLGDCIQFSRIITELADQGASIDVMMPKAHSGLKELLFSVKGIERIEVIIDNNVTLRRRYDFHSPMMSLMKSINLTPLKMPTTSFPYIRLPVGAKEGGRNANLFELITNLDSKKLNVGIVWTTALLESFKKKDYLHFTQKDRKSLRNDDVLTILCIEGFQFFSLHVAKSEAVQHAIDNTDIVDVAPCLQDFTDTATVIEHMDLVISIDTSVAHLAGAMNKPVINLIPFVADWRWQTNREDSPWYPSMRLLKQSSLDDWSVTVDRLQKLLPKIQEHHKKTGDIHVFL